MTEGSALIRICWVSLDPLLRTWISGARSYLDPVKPGSSIPGFGIAKIVKINAKAGSKSGMQAGDWVVGMLEWSEYAVMEIKNIKKLPIVSIAISIGPVRARLQVFDGVRSDWLHVILVHQAINSAFRDLEQEQRQDEGKRRA